MKMFKVFKAQFIVAAFLVFNLCVFYTPAAVYAAGTTYYVSPSGNDSNAGTSSSSPWQTIGKVNSINFAPGDTILFQGGSVFNGHLQFDSNDGGNSTTRVTVDSYGGGRATINGGTGSAITLNGSTGIDVKNINVIGNGRKTGNLGGKGIDFTSCHYCSVTNMEASGFQYAGVRVITSDHIDITYVNAHDNGRAGILADQSTWTAMSDHIYVGNSVANNNPGDPAYPSNESGDGIELLYNTNSTIEYSSASYNGWDQPTGHHNGPEGIFFWSANNCLIQNSLAFKNSSNTGADGGGFDIDGNNCTQQYTYSYANTGPAFTSYNPTDGGSGNIVYRYNISELDNRGDHALWIAAASRPTNGKFNLEVYNNTFYESGNVIASKDWGLEWGGAATDMSGVHYHNNIFYTTGTNILNPDPTYSAGTFTGNIWWQTNGGFNGMGYTSFSAWVNGTGQEKINNVLVGKNADPMLVNPGNGEKIINHNYLTAVTAYKLKTGSPALSAGLNLASLEGLNIGSRDYYGNALGSTHNMGAYEGPGIDPAIFSKVEDTVTGTGNNQFQYSGSWSTGSSGDHYSSNANDYFQISFNGTGIKWVGSADTNQGQAAVSIDNGPETIVDTYLSNRHTGVTLYDSGVLSNGQHTMKVRVTGTKFSASSNYYVSVDLVDITGGGSTNLAVNPGFEADGAGTQTPTGWTEWSGTGTTNASYTESNGGSHSGTYHLTHYNGQTGSWNVYTYRTFTGLTNGTYTLKAWARRSGNGFTASQLEAKDFGGSTLSAAIPDSSSYQELTVSNINVTNGQCTIGFWTQVDNGSNYPYVYMDDVSFTKN
ncbi:hypothetical protein [Cohnella sp.]|uniref:hypothetical protein n=1 Tax=Cohnella sp. TaxID=1883426 RepID=UPI003565DEBC